MVLPLAPIGAAVAAAAAPTGLGALGAGIMGVLGPALTWFTNLSGLQQGLLGMGAVGGIMGAMEQPQPMPVPPKPPFIPEAEPLYRDPRFAQTSGPLVPSDPRWGERDYEGEPLFYDPNPLGVPTPTVELAHGGRVGFANGGETANYYNNPPESFSLSPEEQRERTFLWNLDQSPVTQSFIKAREDVGSGLAGISDYVNEWLQPDPPDPKVTYGGTGDAGPATGEPRTESLGWAEQPELEFLGVHDLTDEEYYKFIDSFPDWRKVFGSRPQDRNTATRHILHNTISHLRSTKRWTPQELRDLTRLGGPGDWKELGEIPDTSGLEEEGLYYDPETRTTLEVRDKGKVRDKEKKQKRLPKYAVGGEVEAYTRRENANAESSIINAARAAIKGQHPDPQRAIGQFVQRFGEEAFIKLRQEVIAEMNPAAATSGLGSFRGVRPGDTQGDGTSDSIPAMIDGQEPAALSQGEWVVPADVVGDLGNGSNEAGSKKLESMVANVRQAKHGTIQQPPDIIAEDILPRGLA